MCLRHDDLGDVRVGRRIRNWAPSADSSGRSCSSAAQERTGARLMGHTAGTRMVRGFRWIAVSCLAALWPVFSLSAEPPPATILVFEQSEAKSQFYSGIFSSLRSTVINNSATPVSIYVESLDLSRFSGPAYLASLRSHLSAKYQDKPVGVIV